MQEKKDLRQNLKISSELHRDIKIAAAQGGEEMYTLVEKAWRLYKRNLGEDRAKQILEKVPIGESPKNEPGKAINTVSNRTEVGIEFTLSEPKEADWVTKFLYILRHAPAETVEAITRNVDQFSLLARLINREEAANDELNRLASELATDRERRVEFLRRVEERHFGDTRVTGKDDDRVSGKGKSNPSKTSARGKH